MKTIEAVASLLLEGPATIMGLSKKIKEMNINDDPCFRSMPDGIYSEEVANIIGRLLTVGYTNLTKEGGYILTLDGKKFCKKLVSIASLREKFGLDLTKRVFGE
jgi:hypothetical protein